jgi:phosphomethylpyrimidine synthase
VADGTIVMPRNVHQTFPARAIGRGLSNKINAQPRYKPEHCNLAEEMSKLDIAVKHGADSVMDLPPPGGWTLPCVLPRPRRGMVGNVPIYACVASSRKRAAPSWT